MEQFAQMNACLKQKSRENERLQSELERLKSTITVRHFALKTLQRCVLRWPATVLQEQTGVGRAAGGLPEGLASPWRPCLRGSIPQWRSACARSELLGSGPAGADGCSTTREGGPARHQPARQ